MGTFEDCNQIKASVESKYSECLTNFYVGGVEIKVVANQIKFRSKGGINLSGLGASALMRHKHHQQLANINFQILTQIHKYVSEFSRSERPGLACVHNVEFLTGGIQLGHCLTFPQQPECTSRVPAVVF